MDALSPPVLANLPTIPNPGHNPDSPAKIRDAAQQFEALLLAEVLRSERESGNGWLNSGEDSAGECATDFGEQQLATALARQGGFGLADLIAKGLETSAAQ